MEGSVSVIEEIFFGSYPSTLRYDGQENKKESG